MVKSFGRSPLGFNANDWGKDLSGTMRLIKLKKATDFSVALCLIDSC